LDELVARINAGGGKEARGLQAAGLGVFPSFIAAIFSTTFSGVSITPMCFNLCKMMGVMSPFVPKVRWMHDM
jgi:hypothetical protein